MRQVVAMMTSKDFEAKQIVFVFLQNKEKISFRNDNLTITDKDGKIKYQITCYRIFALFVVGHFVLTSGIIQRSHKFGFPIFLLTNTMKVYDSLGGKMEGNTLLRKKQYKYKGLNIGRHILLNKVTCQREMLNRQRDKDTEMKGAITLLDGYIDSIQKHDGDLESLLGLEGSAARIYFRNHFNNIEWNGRQPRIKRDFVNATLDIGYTILFNIIDCLLRIYGFDTYCGVLHRQFYMRKSLVCDLVEPFRVIIDGAVRKAINLGQCKEDDFRLVNHQYMLNWDKNPDYVKFSMMAILDHKIQIFNYIQQYYRSFMKGRAIKEYPVFMME